MVVAMAIVNLNWMCASHLATQTANFFFGLLGEHLKITFNINGTVGECP